MQYDTGLSFSGENMDIGFTGSNGMYNPNFGPTYNFEDDHLYGYSQMSVPELAAERRRGQNGLNYDNVGSRYPGPPPPQDYSYFEQRNPLQGFTSSQSSTTNIMVILIIIIAVIAVLTGINTFMLFTSRNKF